MRYVLIFLSLNLWASEQWLCTEDSSQIQGSQILACGVGEGHNESTARQLALKNAQQEFATVCDTQTLCGEHKYSAAPSRSTCEEKDGIWKCYRLVKYSIKEDKRTATVETTTNFYAAIFKRDQSDESIDMANELIRQYYKNALGR